MTSLSQFPLFPLLPTEIRLKIWTYSHPTRILQLGITNGAPFPFLREDQNDEFPVPVPITLPSLFHTNHESRELCLLSYIPFGYAYIHPHLDTLYLSRHASAMLIHNLSAGYGWRIPPLYPIALLDTVAVELDLEDLSNRVQTNGKITMPKKLFDYLFALMRFGTPKELLLVRCQVQDGEWGRFLSGWQSIELCAPVGKSDGQIVDWNERLIEITQCCMESLKGQSWFRWRVPVVKIVGAKREWEVVMWEHGHPKSLERAHRVTEEWLENELRLPKGRSWSWFDDEANPFSPQNTAKTCGRAGIVSNGYRKVPDLSELLQGASGAEG